MNVDVYNVSGKKERVKAEPGICISSMGLSRERGI